MSLPLPTFEAFQPISRLFRDCTITEKLDGTNALVYVAPDGTVSAGSRNRWITPDDDNYGFAKWVSEHADELRTLGPGRHFGEWWGAGIQRRYGSTSRRWSLFNVSKWHRRGTTPFANPQANPTAPVRFSEPAPECCDVVPVLYRGLFTTSRIEEVLARLQAGGSVAAPGWMDPEGIVVHHDHSGKLFKVTLGGDGHKGVRK